LEISYKLRLGPYLC